MRAQPFKRYFRYWRFYIAMLMLLLILQYLICLGMPPVWCTSKFGFSVNVARLKLLRANPRQGSKSSSGQKSFTTVFFKKKLA